MRSAAIKLTLFTLFTTAITALLAGVIGNYQPLRGRFAVEAVFEDATGLLRGDLVTLAGVRVGKVDRVRVEKGYAVASLLVDEEVGVPQTSRFEIRYRNLIGQRVVAIFPSDDEELLLEEGDRVPITQTRGPLDLGAIFNELKALVSIEANDVNTISKALVRSLGPHKEDLDAILAGTSELMGQLAPREEKLTSLITNVATVTDSLAAERQRLADLIHNLAALSGDLAARSGSIERTLVNLETATGDLGKLISDNRQSLDRDLADLATLLGLIARHQDDLARVTKGLDDTLTATLRGTSYGEWANLYVFSLCQSTDPGCLPASSSTASFFAASRSGLKGFLYSALGEVP